MSKLQVRWLNPVWQRRQKYSKPTPVYVPSCKPRKHDLCTVTYANVKLSSNGWAGGEGAENLRVVMPIAV